MGSKSEQCDAKAKRESGKSTEGNQKVKGGMISENGKRKAGSGKCKGDSEKWKVKSPK